MNVKIVIRVLGFLILIEGIAIATALLVSLYYGEYDARAFFISMLINFFSGGLILLLTKNTDKKLGKREAFLIVSLVWVVCSAFGSLPYILSGALPRFHDAFFETMSGFTTTGSTVINNIEILPHGILFWRSITQWLGGMGIVVLSLAVLPVFGIGGMQLFAAEVPGPTPDKFSPRVKHTARALWVIYFTFTMVEIFLLWLGGMSVFDSVCHSFTTMATGGFSTKNASIAFWPSAYIQYVIIFFMFLAGINFTLSFMLFKGKFKRALIDEELKYYFYFVVAFTLLFFGGLLLTRQLGVEKAFRDAMFQVVSIMTTTGFATTDYLLWKPVLIALLFALFFVGGSTGSTGGSIKIMRIVLLFKNSYYELKRMIHPQAVIPVRFNKHTVESKTINNILAFFVLYFVAFGFGTILMMIFEPDLETSMGAVATCLGNIGPGLGKVGPTFTFSYLEPAAKWLLSFLMLIGRLELFTILMLFTPAFWKNS
jgi:trk system potassium uptake protein